jgi:beta-lactamase regulating signal transducer with metallopeptidase domain
MMFHLLDHAGSASLAWASAMARACWQGALAFLLAWLVCRLPWLAPRVQCWLWRVAYLKLLIALFWATPVDLPVLAPSSAPNPAPAHPQTLLVRLLPSPHAAAASGARSGAAVARLPETGAIEIALTPAHRPVANRPPPLFWLLALWLLGVLWCAGLVAREWSLARRLRREGKSAKDEWALASLWGLCERVGLRRPPPLLLATEVGSPAILGFLSPAILLPDTLIAEESRPALELMLGHEVAHLARGDLRWSWVAAVAHNLFYFHPLVWLANREYRLAQEAASDELALRLTGASPGDYAQALVRVAARHRRDWRSAPSALWAVDDSPHVLKRRLNMLKKIGRLPRRDVASGTGPALWRRTAVIALAALATIALVPWRVTAQQAGSAPAAPGRGEASRSAPERSALPPGAQTWFYLSPAEGWSASTRISPPAPSVDAQWEEMLLLEAMHYLSLTRPQLEAMLPLASGAAERLEKVSARDRESLAAVMRVAQRNRADLLAGRAPSTGGQADALRTRAAIRQRREQASQEIVTAVLPTLTRILTREQILRAYLLTLGEPPKERVASAGPALTDPEAGFALGREGWETWRDATISSVLADRYPPRITNAALNDAQIDIRDLHADILRPARVTVSGSSGAASVDSVFVFRVIDPLTPPGKAIMELDDGPRMDHDRLEPEPLSPQEKVLADKAATEAQQLRDRYDRFPQLLLNGASEAELETALRNFTRRVFTSPRLVPALQARLGKSSE